GDRARRATAGELLGLPAVRPAAGVVLDLARRLRSNRAAVDGPLLPAESCRQRISDRPQSGARYDAEVARGGNLRAIRGVGYIAGASTRRVDLKGRFHQPRPKAWDFASRHSPRP